MVILLDRIDDSHILDARIPRREGTGHASRPCADNKDFGARREGHCKIIVNKERVKERVYTQD
jgi:hypothetical protein